MKPIRSLLAIRPSKARNVGMHRALFAVDATAPRLVAAWWQGNTLDAKAAAAMWAAHPWQLSQPAPPDVAAAIEQGLQLEACQR